MNMEVDMVKLKKEAMRRDKEEYDMYETSVTMMKDIENQNVMRTWGTATT